MGRRIRYKEGKKLNIKKEREIIKNKTKNKRKISIRIKGNKITRTKN